MPSPAESARLLGTPPPSSGPVPTPTNPPRRARPPLLSVPSSQSVRSARSVRSMEPVIANYRSCDVDSINLESISDSHKNFSRWAYISYYLPILRWLPQYNAKESLLGDVLAGATMASFQMPLVMSLATSLAKLPPLVGLYSVVGAATAYAIFGGVPVLVVGPSPGTAVLYGQVIEDIVHSSKEMKLTNLEVSATISVGMSAILLACGLLKWGFLDNIFSRALLKGFIGAMGVVMIINQFVIQLGLQDLAAKEPHHSIIDKVVFAVTNAHQAHRLTVCVTVFTLLIVLIVRKFKNTLVNRYGIKSAVYIPELLGMVVVATILSYSFDWESKGVEIVGDLTKTKKTKAAVVAAESIIINPFKLSRFPLFKKVFQTSFLCSILGFFDSTTATKALGARYNYNVSSNRELVALGMCNFAITMFGGLPSFGALGRSKVNILAGASTPMATSIMAAIVVIAIRYLLPLLYYLPECVLALSTTIIGLTVLEEVPHDIAFFWEIDGYDEIISLLVVFATTILWSVESGVILAIVIAVVRIIKAGTQSRIHILGRVPNTSVFRNADELIEESFSTYTEAEHQANSESTSTDNLAELVAEIQQIEGVLIIKIPEPLNFANSGALRGRLSRIEKFGTLSVHPSQPSNRGFEDGAIKFVIFDCKGMTSIDASATQTLCEIVRRYSEVNNICVSFARVPTNSQVRNRFRSSGIAGIVNSNYKRYVKGRSSQMLSGGGSSTSLRTYTVATRLGDGFFLSIDEALKAFDIESV
ncbi:hypothetical protein FT663_04182 [Candidozyma haemuli var. vulneris]|uniref:STAS domain-containing protein n=1 Tax=Candidozyma haemuli TaxID=45357 RepID=A0A2V1ALH9_9ASCO|nr:hypothetical protein CXQ85_000973 [[Candida] haemuloni]KAF3986868.1 hypothetical protein FT662_04333 [[Candida] haemuloni var. vulneris]KAF3988060.1 hypothetical protein FT663_04182 [[Candida] haemuloni var. vulneris]PVH18688.1 hypothetical protein CXQ85_000973 [[Candida] haemuloni]